MTNTTNNEEFASMSYDEAGEAIRQTFMYNQNVVKSGAPKTKQKVLYLSSHPGTGKSALIKSIADELNVPVVEVFLSEYDPSEVGGFVYREGDVMRKARPWYLPSEGKGILMLEEFSDAATAVQNVACRLIRERQLGDHKLGDGWTIIACGNRAKDRSGAQQLVKKFNNRVCMITLEPATEHWIETASRLGFHPAVIGYINRTPQSLNKFNPLHEVSPTARTWEMVSDAVSGMTLPEATMRKFVSGYIGKGEANNFMGFYKRMNELPDAADIIAAPDVIAVPGDIDL